MIITKVKLNILSAYKCRLETKTIPETLSLRFFFFFFFFTNTSSCFAIREESVLWIVFFLILHFHSMHFFRTSYYDNVTVNTNLSCKVFIRKSRSGELTLQQQTILTLIEIT